MNSPVPELPEEVFDNILSYISYTEISRLRLVNKWFDAACQRMLNQGFYKVEKFHVQCFHPMKKQMPKKESERQKHPFSTHFHILTIIESRLLLLRRTFIKYMKLKYCCFIPGKVLDEIFKLIRHVSNELHRPQSYRMLQELRDISSMAVKHFDEKIAPAFRSRFMNSSMEAHTPNIGSIADAEHFRGTPADTLIRQYSSLGFLKRNNCYQNLQSKYSELEKEKSDCRRKLQELVRKLSKQNAVSQEQSVQIGRQEREMSELSQKFMKFDKNMMEDTIIDFEHKQDTSTEDDDGDSNVNFDEKVAVSLNSSVKLPSQEDLETLQSKLNDEILPPLANQDEDIPSSLLVNQATATPPMPTKEVKSRETTSPKRQIGPVMEPQKKRMRTSENQ